MTDHRVIVTGSRSWPDEQAVWLALAEVLNTLTADDTLTVVHGDCPSGADSFARSWCALPADDPHADGDHRPSATVLEERHPADWDRYGRGAGPIRNREMVDAGADLVLAFPLPGPRNLSKGTWDCIDAAEAHGIPVEIIAPKEAAITPATVSDLFPIEGGYCVKRLADGRCVDVLRMAFNWRLVLTAADPGPHTVMDAGWCYFGHGTTPDGSPRRMSSAFLAAMAAANVWDGIGEPPGYDKRAF